MSKINSLSDLRQYILSTLEKLDSGDISVQKAAVIVKGCDTVNAVYRTELEQARLMGQSNNVKFIEQKDQVD